MVSVHGRSASNKSRALLDQARRWSWTARPTRTAQARQEGERSNRHRDCSVRLLRPSSQLSCFSQKLIRGKWVFEATAFPLVPPPCWYTASELGSSVSLSWHIFAALHSRNLLL